MATPEVSLGNCQVCDKEPALGVASVPGVPISVAYGAACLAANAQPYWVVVANTVAIGGTQYAALWWHQTIDWTLEHLGISHEQFNADVEQGLKDEQEYSEKLASEEETPKN